MWWCESYHDSLVMASEKDFAPFIIENPPLSKIPLTVRHDMYLHGEQRGPDWIESKLLLTHVDHTCRNHHSSWHHELSEVLRVVQIVQGTTLPATVTSLHLLHHCAR